MKQIKVLLLMAGPIFWLTACSALFPALGPTSTPYPTYTVFPTYTLYPTYTPYPPRELPTATLAPTINPELITDKAAGTWLVGSMLAAGKWRANGDCYAVTRDRDGNQLDLVTGFQSVITVPADAYLVEFISVPDYCTWTYLGE